ncbi:thermophilic B-1,4-xylanase from Nonomuraea Flexuosa, partial [Microthyrium microscopicum]
MGGGRYTAKWNGVGNFVAGKGWKIGSSRSISFNGTFSTGGNSYLAVYGWTKNPLIEYYIVENYGTYNPIKNAKDSKRTVTSDGGTYDIATSVRDHKDSIQGIATFTQFWSVRRQQRSSGTVNVANHFAAWQKSGMKLGNHDYQIVATEGYQSSGSSDITV